MRSGRWSPAASSMATTSSAISPPPRPMPWAAAPPAPASSTSASGSSDGPSALPGAQDLVDARVGGLVDGLARRIGVEPGDGAADPLRERDLAGPAGDEALDLRVVEQRVPALVADQAGAGVGIQLVDERA